MIIKWKKNYCYGTEEFYLVGFRVGWYDNNYDYNFYSLKVRSAKQNKKQKGTINMSNSDQSTKEAITKTLKDTNKNFEDVVHIQYEEEYPNDWDHIKVEYLPENQEIAEYISNKYKEAGLDQPEQIIFLHSPHAVIEHFKQIDVGVEKCIPSLIELGRFDEPFDGFLYAMKDVAVYHDKPTVKLSAEGPHCEDGPAVEFGDGFGCYFVNGHVVDPMIINHPEDLTVDKILMIPNIETRRVAMEIFGIEEFINQGNFEEIDMDFVRVSNASETVMPRKLFKDHKNDQWLVGTDGSTSRLYIMNVDPNAKTCKEAHEGISGLSESNCIGQS
jgi:hypothetical protein